MELKIFKIIEASQLLEKLAFNTNIKGKYSFKLLKNLENLLKEIERFEKLREPLIKEYCDKDDKGNPIIKNDNYQFSDKEKEKKLVDKLNEILNSTTEVNIEMIDSEAFDDVDISIAQLSQIYFMIKQEEE